MSLRKPLYPLLSIGSTKEEKKSSNMTALNVKPNKIHESILSNDETDLPLKYERSNRVNITAECDCNSRTWPTT